MFSLLGVPASVLRLPWLGVLLVLVLLPLTLLPVAAKASLAPTFTLPDTNGSPHALTADRGHPVAMFFFCGCARCHACATLWGRFQHGQALAPRAPGSPAPRTVVVFSGRAPEARAFAAETGLDIRQTTLLLDPTLRVTQNLYHAEPCPHAFVLDSHGRICDAANIEENAGRDSSPAAVASDTLTALRAAETAPVSHPPHLALTGVTPIGERVDISRASGWCRRSC